MPLSRDTDPAPTGDTRHTSDPVQLRRLAPQVSQQGLRPERLAGDPLRELRGGVPLAVAVDVLPQPAEQGGELAAGELRVEVAEVFSRLLEELGGVEVAERVGREVAERAAGPVDVLET